jgi:hypothetical protein
VAWLTDSPVLFDSCVDGQAQLLTGCDDGRVMLWAYSHDHGLQLLTSARAHAHRHGPDDSIWMIACHSLDVDSI